MKKLAFLAALLMAVAGCIPACAEAELASLSDDALLALLDSVQQEIIQRGIAKSALLPAGNYIGGRDLPVGGYVLASVENGGDSGCIELYGLRDEEGDRDDILYEFLDNEKSYSFYVYLEEGYELILPFPFHATISNGIMFN
ncbi:MAG: hypothetical protein E7331_08235 [Clostridiales bacterium]|nr:hypothetical protein [Clostridiales bacterium]